MYQKFEFEAIKKELFIDSEICADKLEELLSTYKTTVLSGVDDREAIYSLQRIDIVEFLKEKDIMNRFNEELCKEEFPKEVLILTKEDYRSILKRVSCTFIVKFPKGKTLSKEVGIFGLWTDDNFINISGSLFTFMRDLDLERKKNIEEQRKNEEMRKMLDLESRFITNKSDDDDDEFDF